MRTLSHVSVIATGIMLAVPRASVSQIRSGDGSASRSVNGGPYPIDPEAASRPTLRAMRASGPIIIDGVIDDPPWEDAQIATGFIQSKPDTGHPASENSEVRIVFDDDKLYIGAVLYDREPDLLVAQRMEQDFLSPDEDVFGFSLDTFHDRSNAYYIFINPNGAIRDGQAFDNSRASNVEWEGIMEVETTVHEDGWSVEVAIPFTTLRFDPSQPGQEWGLNLLRRVRRRGEDALWAPVAFRTRIHKMDEAGTLVGLEGLTAGRNITVKPFLLGGDVSGSVPERSDLGGTADGGVDVKWGITPRLTADLTWRTDFSQVEVDQEQVNLTRFSLFFPEKREFFVENSGTYQFGDLSEPNYRLGASPRDFTLFHSRRIGLQGGRLIPIVGGGRLTGRAGSVQMGLLNKQTESTDALGSENFTVARLRRSLFGAVDVGGIFINRQATDGSEDYNRSWGVDVNARFAGNLIVHSYFAATHEPGVDGDNSAGRISAAWRDSFWDASVLYRSFGDTFNPGVGFVRRPAVRHSYATLGVHPRSSIPTVAELNPYLEVERFTGLDGTLETRNLVGGLTVTFLDGGRLDIRGTDRFESLDEDFVLSQGVVPTGRYDFREGSVSYVASRARTLAGSVRVSGGGWFQGERRSIGGSVVWRPSAHVAVDVGADHNVIDLTGEVFTADVLSSRLDYAYSTKLLVGTWLQYNDATREFVSNFRINFIHSPLSDFFLVYAERRHTDTGSLLDRRLTAKLTKLLAF